MNSYDYYKNMAEEEAPEFDNRWQETAKKLGYNSSTANNRLEYGHH